MNKQNSRDAKSEAETNHDINARGNIVDSIIINGDNNTVSLGGKLIKTIILFGVVISSLLFFSVLLLAKKNTLSSVTSTNTSLPLIFPLTEIVSVTPTVISTFTDTPAPTFTSTVTFTATNTFTPTPVTMIDKKSLMALIPSGFFQMQGKQGLVKIYLNSFYIDQNEVTNAQYEECVIANVCSKPYEDAGAQYVNVEHFGDSHYGNFPVVLVSWNMANNYCNWRSEGTRLPTDVEWEKAARGSIAGQIYPWGNDLPVCVEGALNGANFSRCDSADAFPVRQFAPNDYGLYDMAGNVGEWVNNSIIGTPGGERMIRGGSWLNDATKITVYSYINASPLNGFVETGFRCAKDLP